MATKKKPTVAKRRVKQHLANSATAAQIGRDTRGRAEAKRAEAKEEVHEAKQAVRELAQYLVALKKELAKVQRNLEKAQRHLARLREREGGPKAERAARHPAS